MNSFDAFYRFFPLGDDNNLRPTDLLVPKEPYSTLPALPGDSLRWLVPVADCVGIPVEKLSITIRPKGSEEAGILCGIIRRQAGTMYTEIRLRVDAAPSKTTYTQFALMIGSKTVMNTFRGQQTDLEAYIQAIVNHFASYGFTYVECDRMGREIRIRVYPNDRLRLSGEKIRIGIGTVRERNENSPSLLTKSKLNVNLSAEDRYDVHVSADIQKGNLYVMDSTVHVATGTEKPADILSALGISSGKLSRPGGTNVVVYAQPGSQTVANTNKPTLQLLFDSTLSGNDRYVVIVSADVRTGNTYQISAPGVATKTVVATTSDTKASIEAQFNAVNGKFVLPTGTVPTFMVLSGKQTIANINNPLIRLINKVALPARTMDQHTIWVGQSVLPGNQYELTAGTAVKSVVALPGDTVDNIAKGLGFSTNPFVLEVTPGTPVRGISRRGPRYHEPDNLSPVTLISSRTWNNIPYVCEVRVPYGLPAGEYQFCLQKGAEVIGVSNYAKLVSSKKETALLRFGAERPGSIFGMTYAEDGLMQQIRVGLYLAEPDLRQSESLYVDLNNQTVRGRTSASLVRMLTTQMEYNSFHRNLYFALKHPLLTIDNCSYRCEGDVQQGPVIGTLRRRKRQVTAQLTQLEGYDYRPVSDAITDSLSGTYALIESLAGLDGLWLAAKRLNFVETIVEGMVLPAADYQLLLRVGADPLQLTVGQDGVRVGTYLLSPNKLNRIDMVRFSAGRVSLRAKSVQSSVGVSSVSAYNPQNAEVDEYVAEQMLRPGDFGADFNEDYNHQ